MEALDLAKNQDNEISPNLRMDIFNDAGQLLGFEGHSADAEQLLRQAVEIGRTRPVPKSTLVTALCRLGQYLRYAGRFDEAETVLHQALILAGPHPTVSANMAFEQLGAIRIKRGDLTGAEQYYRQRRDLMMSLGGPDNGTTMDARSRWAALQARMGHVPQALQEQRDNLVRCRKAFAAGSAGLWHPLCQLAFILNMAEQPAEALAAAQESLSCYGSTTGSDLRLGQIKGEMGVALVKLHRYAEALPYLEESVRINSASPAMGPSSYTTRRVQGYLEHAKANLTLASRH
jgi:tetratricopeptide (TPR) repeat protein